MSTRFWRMLAAAAWTGLLLIAALVLALESRGRYPMWDRPAPEGTPFGLEAPAASPPMRLGDASEMR